jgi:hypothetical protein
MDLGQVRLVALPSCDAMHDRTGQGIEADYPDPFLVSVVR